MSLEEQISTPDGKRRYVRTLFATIADRYDLITVLLSYGRDRYWKRRLVAMADARPGKSALDLATGTGDIAFALNAGSARVVGLDVTFRMIELPIASWEAPRRDRQNRSLMTTTRSRPSASLSVNVRPCTGATPSSAKKFGDALATLVRSAPSASVRVTETGSRTARSAKLVFRRRHSSTVQ